MSLLLPSWPWPWHAKQSCTSPEAGSVLSTSEAPVGVVVESIRYGTTAVAL
jgi:hypothetical protein